ncbi:MAG TPA: DUF4388 domain-containing protein [Ktedonobacterales bacterium]|jgi:hypothetical protein
MQQPGRILDGDLETLGLQATLKMLALSGKTGTLMVTSGQDTLSLYLNKGQIAGLQDNFVQRPNLLAVMRSLRQIDGRRAAELHRAIGPNSPDILGLLVDYQVISEAEMFQWQEYGVIQALSRAVRWQQGRFEFHRNVLQGAQLALNVDHVLLESLRQADEWDEAASIGLNRTTVARWMSHFTGDIMRLGLEPDAVNVLCLANGQLPLQAIAYALLASEARVAQCMGHLLSLRLIEVVDQTLETELERNLVDVLTASQHELSKLYQGSTEQRLLALVKTLATCVNGLLTHHGAYARHLRGRGAVPPAQVTGYLEETFGPLLQQACVWWPIVDTVVVFQEGQLDYQEILALHKLVKGEQLQSFYWDVMSAFHWLMLQMCTKILEDEVGSSRSERRFRELWDVFLQEIEEQARALQGNGGEAFLQERAAARRGGSSERSYDGRQSNPGMTQAGMRYMDSDPRMVPMRERRRLS